jgi:predicted HicB family RNase H-like nuclease
MAIAKNPNRYQSNTGDREWAAEKFIAGAAAPAAAGSEAAGEASTRKVPIMVRFDRTLLKRVDVEARRRGVSRSSWIQYVISKVLDEGAV